MTSLIEIGKKYPTNKNDYGFLDIYEKYFKNLKDKKLNILEIGVDKGDSLRLWNEYFTNANICGLDIDKKDFSIDGVEIYQGDQNDKSLLNEIAKKYGKFDIIIDDGSHLLSDQLFSLNYFYKYLVVGGYYIIEDYKFPNYFKHLNDVNDIKINELIKKINNKETINSKLLSPETINDLLLNNKNIFEYKGNLDHSDIVFFEKTIS